MKRFILAFALQLHTLSAELEISLTGPRLAEEAAMLEELNQAVDPDQAADVVLKYYSDGGFSAVDVLVEDAGKVRSVEIDVLPFGQISALGGKDRVLRAARSMFQDLSGQSVREDVLTSRLRHFEANPLHKASTQLAANDSGDAVDVLLNLEGSRQQRISAGWSDSGAQPLPRQRFWLGGEFGDLWGRGSLLSGRVTVSPDASEFSAYQLSERFFRPGGAEWLWQLGYSSADGETQTGRFDAFTFLAGLGWQKRFLLENRWSLVSRLGVNYRRSNNALEFGVEQAEGLADVLQASAGVDLERRGERDRILARIEVIASPGVTSEGADGDHSSLRLGTSGDYVISRASVRYRRALSRAWEVDLHAAGQWTSEPVLQADQLALGGVTGLRGLEEQSGLGDRGVLVGAELFAPAYELPDRTRLRASLFLQAGETVDEVLNESESAVSGGAGLNLSWRENLTVSFSAGWRLDRAGSEVHSQLRYEF